MNIIDSRLPTTIEMMACHQVSPRAISELPVMYVEMFESVNTPIAGLED